MTVSRITTKHDGFIAGLDWVTLPERPANPGSRAKYLSLVDLFCSCGGMTLGVWEGARVSKRRVDVRLAVDLMPEPIGVYKQNFSDIADENVLIEDVGNLFDGLHKSPPTKTERRYKRIVGSLDLLVAGPPCQGHSDLNNSTRRNDPRNALYLRVARAVEILKPRVVIIENVPAVKHDQGGVVPATEDWLSGEGYNVSTSVIHFSRFGVPQSRKRHILLAVRGTRFTLSDLSDFNVPEQTVGTYIAGLEKSANTNGLMTSPPRVTKQNAHRIKYLFDNDLHELPDKKRPPCHRDKKHAYVSMYGRMYWNKPAQTLTSGFGSMGQGRYVHPTEQRLITPHEAARIQGIPDFFDFSSAMTLTGLRKMIANAVPPQFTANLVAKLIQCGGL
ncbi:MAG: DNA (cytosine-5-)-methyltransferase [Blastopirellula sp.]|nr:MAG: DNA (cytosine-5-)-methyltransferase [Blastopirellula sp.]